MNLAPAISALNQGEIIAYPTEGVYGLGCDPLNEAAVLRLLALKQRAVSKGLILLAASVEQIMPYLAPVPTACLQQALNTWPGPVTWVFPAAAFVPSWICGDHVTVAVRVTNHPIARALCEGFGRPIVSTSANIAAQASALTAGQVAATFPEGIAVIVPGELGGLKGSTPIYDVLGGGVVR